MFLAPSTDGAKFSLSGNTIWEILYPTTTCANPYHFAWQIYYQGVFDSPGPGNEECARDRVGWVAKQSA
jgi:hypothetical protein